MSGAQEAEPYKEGVLSRSNSGEAMGRWVGAPVVRLANSQTNRFARGGVEQRIRPPATPATSIPFPQTGNSRFPRILLHCRTMRQE